MWFRWLCNYIVTQNINMELKLTEEQIEFIKDHEGFSIRKMASEFSKKYTKLFTQWISNYYKDSKVPIDYDYFLKNGHQPFGLALIIESKCAHLYLEDKE